MTVDVDPFPPPHPALDFYSMLYIWCDCVQLSTVQCAYCIVLFIVSSEPAKSVCTTSSIRPVIIIHENDDNFDDDKDHDVGDEAGSFYGEYLWCTLTELVLLGNFFSGKFDRVWP